MVTPTTALNCHVLVLNKHYMAVRVTHVKRAISLIFKDLAEVIDFDQGQYLNYDFESWLEVSQLKKRFEPHEHDWLHTVHLSIAVPRVVRLLSYDRMPRPSVTLNRRNIFARDRSRCQYCGRHLPTSELSLDHVIPRSQGGQTTWDNIVCACIKCNVKKGGRRPHQAGMKLINAPVKPRYSPVMGLSVNQGRYRSWKQFLNHAYWSVELK